MNRLFSRHQTGRARNLRRICAVVAILGVFAAACSSMNGDAVVLGDELDASPPPPTFTPRAGEDAEASAPEPTEPLELCIATSCPWPLATCGLDPYKCTTDLSLDINNCGECGLQCPSYPGRHLISHCAGGKCEFECSVDATVRFFDCNGFVDDGCEAELKSDPENCGSCGHACAPGLHCHAGFCGCPAGQNECDGKCVDLRIDSYNCGSCGTTCNPRVGSCSPRPPNTTWGCEGGECGQLVCMTPWEDCNGDLGLSCAGSDGCETYLGSDVANCGACGNHCKNDESCIDGQCVPDSPSTCPDGMALCNGLCADLLNDSNNCGACSAPCNPNGSDIVLCRKGMCRWECAPGRADCDGISGCETNLMNDPTNCGVCGNRCDTAAGQPCIAGKCLMTTCDAGGAK